MSFSRSHWNKKPCSGMSNSNERICSNRIEPRFIVQDNGVRVLHGPKNIRNRGISRLMRLLIRKAMKTKPGPTIQIRARIYYLHQVNDLLFAKTAHLRFAKSAKQVGMVNLLCASHGNNTNCLRRRRRQRSTSRNIQQLALHARPVARKSWGVII